MNKNATIPTKVCPPGKELNPVTKKTCLNLCKKGTIRNLLTAKCDKNPDENNKPLVTTKVCPPGKELNPVTKKTCLNLCKEGTIRNLLTAKCDKIPNENNVFSGPIPKFLNSPSSSNITLGLDTNSKMINNVKNKTL
jgi:hypothetical protein